LSPSVSVAARAYCSTANLGAGFDVFGLALKKYSDVVHVRKNKTDALRITVSGPYSKDLPRAIDKNSAGPPARALLEASGSRFGIEITIEKNVPPGLGLGSSGASAAACTKAMDHLLDLELSNDELVEAAGLGEAAVSGSAHLDNVGASLLGGFVIAYGRPVRVVTVRAPKNLSIVVVSPKQQIRKNKTGFARELVPRKIEVKDAVLNVGRASAVTLGFSRGDIGLIGSGMEDSIAEPYRERLVPGYRAVKKSALEAGASGVAISGAGPSVVALVDQTRQEPQRIGRLMVREFAKNRFTSTFFVTRPAEGASVIRG